MKFLYPVGLTAAIFSMETKSVPFNLTPENFLLTFFSLLIIVYLTRFVGYRVVRSAHIIRRLSLMPWRWWKAGRVDMDNLEIQDEKYVLP